jgi:hypothetical protein
MMRLLVLVLLSLGWTGSAFGQPLSGVWHGRLEAGSTDLRMELELLAQDEGLQASLISLDQGGARIPASAAERDGTRLRLTFNSIAARYEAEVMQTRLSGVFVQGGEEFDLEFVRGRFDGERAPGAVMDRPGDDVFVDGAVRLAGTLLRPDTPGAAPGVVLLNGSGSQDRDSTVAGQPGFALLAEALAAEGIVTIRMDDRGVGQSDPVPPDSPSDLARDAAHALAFLRGQPGVDPACTGFVGHSEGALIAFLAAGQHSDPAFIVSLAGMTGRLQDILVEQGEALNRAMGATEEQIGANRAMQEAVFAAIENAAPGEAGQEIERTMLANGVAAQVAAQQARIWGQTYVVEHFKLEPRAAFARYEGPVLAYYAEHDLQILPGPNRRRLEAAREGLPTRIEILPGLNHLFQESETGLPAEYATRGHAMAPTARETISQGVAVWARQACD